MKFPPVDPRIDEYIDKHRQIKDSNLLEMEQIARERGFPIIGPQVGMFLYMLVKTTGAKQILEMGSGFGYSAYWMAVALPEDGGIVCIESDNEMLHEALRFFEMGGLMNKADFRVGNALEVIEEFDGPFDLIFNDVDKEDYPVCVGKALPRLKSGGFFITDNSLWDGRVVYDPPPDESTRGVVTFNRMMYLHKDFDTTIIPIRDGLTVARKK